MTMTMLTLVLAAYVVVGIGLAIYEMEQVKQSRNNDTVPGWFYVLVALLGPPVFLAGVAVALVRNLPYLVGRLCGNVARRFAEGYAAGNAR